MGNLVFAKLWSLRQPVRYERAKGILVAGIEKVGHPFWIEEGFIRFGSQTHRLVSRYARQER